MENLNHKNKTMERENTLKKMQQKQFLKMKNNLLEKEKEFFKLKDRKLKNKEVKIKREIEELLFKPILMFIDDIDKVEQK